jgi:hypothetical protein
MMWMIKKHKIPKLMCDSYRANDEIKDDLCDYVLFFRGDQRREIHLWPQHDNFKHLIEKEGKLGGNMLDFHLQFVLQYEKPSLWK